MTQKYTLDEMIAMTNLRQPSFQIMIDHLKTIEEPLIIETGCIRPGDQPWSTYENSFKDDGMSTIIFDQLINDHNGEFHSVDLTPEHVEYAQSMISDKSQVHCDDSVHFLWDAKKNLEENDQYVDVLYLDSYDWVKGREPECMAHHIKELACIVSRIRSGGLVAVDDNYKENGRAVGKGVYVIEFMESIGAEMIHDGVQCVWRMP
jgi:hypothetical protein